MAIVQALLAALTRSAGKLLNTAFGWATVLLFGKVPADRQHFLVVIAFGSVAWVVVVLGVFFPSVATFLLAFVPVPDWLDQNWVRLAMLAAAVVIPLIVGAASLPMRDPEDRPRGLGGRAKAVLQGYPYALGMALTLAMMTVLAPVMKLHDLVRRWTSQHVPIMVEPDDYLTVVEDVEQALARGDLPTRREPASWMLRLPTKVLTLFAGGAVENLAADRLTTLKSEKVEVLLHPADLVIRGRELDAAHATAVIVEQLTFTKAYLTWDKEANELEDRLRAIWNLAKERAEGAVPTEAADRLATAERDLRRLNIAYEEWEVLFRQKLQVERALLQVAAGVTRQPQEPRDAPVEAQGAARLNTSGLQAPARPAPPQGDLVRTLLETAVVSAVVSLVVVIGRGLFDLRDRRQRRRS